MSNDLERNAIALELLPTCLETFTPEDAAAIAFQTADNFLALSQEKLKSPEIRIILEDVLWTIDGTHDDEICLSRWNEEDQGYDYNFVKMETFFAACGKAFRGVKNGKT